MLGQPAREAWTENWTFIGPLLEQIMSGGEAVWNEDLLLPIFRNGQMEDVYWTFSCSPVLDEKGHPAGVLVTCHDTTSKVLALRSLVNGRRNFYNMLMQAPVAICVLREPEYIVEMANDLMLELWGTTAEEIMYKPIFEGLSQAADQGLEALLHGVYTTGEPWLANEMQVNLTRNGKMEAIYLNFIYEAFRENDGPISGIIAVAVEVTDQVNARKKIEEVEERARLAIEASRLGIWDYNPLTEELQFDEATIKMFEHDSRQPVNLEAFWTKMHPDDRETALQKMQRAIDPTIPDNYYAEYRLQLANGNTRWIQATGQAFFDENQVPVRFSGTVQDITDRKTAEEELRLTNEKFHLLAESMPQFVWTGDVSGHLGYFNQAVYDYSGLTPAQIEQVGWLQIVHPDDREENVKRWLHSIQTGADFIFEHRFRRHDGQYTWQLSRAVAQRDALGNIKLWVGTSTDIHQQKIFTQELESQVLKRTAELEKSNASLSKLNKELADFTYIASHDLQEPLRKIQTFSDRIIKREFSALSPSGQDDFQRLQRTAERMQTLLDDLLSYSKTSTTERIFENQSLEAILEEVKDEFKEVMQDKAAVIESSGLGFASIIPFQFRQVFNNLIGNALKFSRPGVAPHISVTAQVEAGLTLHNEKLDRKKNYWHITLRDNGIGFEPKFNERIFLIFQKLHGRSEYKGTGVGLAIVKKIIENHHGEITASGEPGSGARFDIYIPAT